MEGLLPREGLYSYGWDKPPGGLPRIDPLSQNAIQCSCNRPIIYTTVGRLPAELIELGSESLEPTHRQQHGAHATRTPLGNRALARSHVLPPPHSNSHRSLRDLTAST